MKAQKKTEHTSTTTEPIECPFKVVDIITEGFEGWANFVHKDGYPIAMVNKAFVPELKELVAAWEELHKGSNNE